MSAGRQRRNSQAAKPDAASDDSKVPVATKKPRKQKQAERSQISPGLPIFVIVAILLGIFVWQQTSTTSPAASPPAGNSNPAQSKPEKAAGKEDVILAKVDKEVVVMPGTEMHSVQERGLVSLNVEWSSVLAEHGKPGSNTTHRHFLHSVLAYVTPWNSLGYDMAKKFRAKFTHVSPVWYQLKRDREKLELLGRHDVDRNWINDVRKKGHPLIVPRVVLEGWPIGMLVHPAEQKQAIDLIAWECKNMAYDGIVLEAWTAWAMYDVLDKPDLRQKALEFVQALGTALHSLKASKLGTEGRSMQLHFVIPPPTDIKRDTRSFTPADMAVLEGFIDGLSVMTYDFSGPNQPGPNAPASWVKKCLQNLPKSKSGAASNVLLGLNFYGNDFILPRGGGPITGHQYVAVLEKYKPEIHWDEEFDEHLFIYETQREKHVVFYPTLKSISIRLDAAKQAGAGISIWEIGQGLEYFFDLL